MNTKTLKNGAAFTSFAKLPLTHRLEIIAQCLIFVLVALSISGFLFPQAVAAMSSWQHVLIGALMVLPYIVIFTLALRLTGPTTAVQRWSLFFLSFLLASLSLTGAAKLSERLAHPAAKALAAAAAFIAIQIALSQLFSIYLNILGRLFA